jgi:hypothetical protein
LKVAEVDLSAARTHKEQFQEISQASEAALAALNTTFDEYETSTETQIARHEVQKSSFLITTRLTLRTVGMQVIARKIGGDE